MDVIEHVKREDAVQASVVMAWIVYNAAMRDQPLPRKPMPPGAGPATPKRGASDKQPATTD